MRRPLDARTAPGTRNDADRGRFLAYGIAAFVAAAGTAVLIVIIAVGNSNSSALANGSGSGSGPQTGFIFFEEIHTTLVVSPGTAGENTIDVIIGYHDGTPYTEASSLTVSVARAGEKLGDFDAEPVTGSPGAFRVSGVAIPSAGDWEFGVTVAAPDAKPLSDTTVISIGEPSSGA